MKEFDFIVYIGRFQPFHNGHLAVLKEASEKAHNVIVILGSSFQPRTFKNPFTWEERMDIIDNSTINLDISLDYGVIGDELYNENLWITNVQEIVSNTISFYRLLPNDDPDPKIGIIGHYKDESSYYLDSFPQWEKVIPSEFKTLDASSIRDLYFSEKNNDDFLSGVLDQSCLEFLKGFRETEDFQNILEERKYIESYKKIYNNLPFPPVFVTGDSVVTQNGHVLLIKRKTSPGKGLWALPGGFLDTKKDKTMMDCCLRELKEETGLTLNGINKKISDPMVFDAINRSARGRTITHAIHIEIDEPNLLVLEANDDASEAEWVSFNKMNPRELFDDHYDIIQTFIRR